MKKKIFLSLLFAIFSFCAFAQTQDPAVGYWKSVDEKSGKVTGVWETEIKSDGMLYGFLLWIPDESPATKAVKCTQVKKYTEFMYSDPASRTVLNTEWIYKLKKDAAGEWSRGYIIDPSDGKHYNCSVKVSGGTLVMRGSLDKKGVLGRSQTWQAISKDEVDAMVAEAKAKYGL